MEHIKITWEDAASEEQYKMMLFHINNGIPANKIYYTKRYSKRFTDFYFHDLLTTKERQK